MNKKSVNPISGLTYIEFLIATRDEVDVEAELLSLIEEGDAGSDFLTDTRNALHEIERLKLSGCYQAERERLARIYAEHDKAKIAEIRCRNPNVPDLDRFKPDPVLRERFENLMKGLKSPDVKQRARFRQFRDATGLADRVPWETLPLIGALEKAKEKQGRPSSNPRWREIAWALDDMRLLVSRGLSIPQAAKEVAKKEGRSNKISRAEYFERSYRKREKLRK